MEMGKVRRSTLSIIRLEIKFEGATTNPYELKNSSSVTPPRITVEIVRGDSNRAAKKQNLRQS